MKFDTQKNVMKDEILQNIKCEKISSATKYEMLIKIKFRKKIKCYKR